jgi:hypothetical protein
MTSFSVQKLQILGIIFLRVQGRPALATTYQTGQYSSYFHNFTLFSLANLRHKIRLFRHVFCKHI